jgi:Tfp pilus assembly protein PilN
MENLLAILLLSLALAVPAYAKQQPTVTVTTDRFTGVTTVKMKPEFVIYGQSGAALSLAAVATSDSPMPALVLVVDASDWQFLHGVTAHALIDGQRVDLEFQPTATKITPQTGFVGTHEVLLAAVPKAMLDRIANCVSLEMEIGASAFSMKSKGLEPLRDFDAALSALSQK